MVEDERINYVVVRCKHGELVKVNKNVIESSRMLKDMLEVSMISDNNEPLNFSKLTGRILKKINVWADLHTEAMKTYKSSEISVDNNFADENDNIVNLKPWQNSFLNVDQTTLSEIILTANYLQIDKLTEMCAQFIANKMSGKTTDEMRSMFNLVNDFTPEELKQINKEMEWCEESED